MKNAKRKITVLSWALYDLANQFFILLIVSLYFPRWVTMERGSPEIYYSLAYGASMLLVAVTAPFMGTIADIKKKHKLFLVVLTLISVACTMLLFTSYNVLLALMLFAVANFGCQGAIIFYNSLMTKVASKERLGLVSGFGRMFGYTGAILALYLTKPVLLKMGYHPAFLLTGILFFIFALPCMVMVKETSSGGEGGMEDADLFQEVRSRVMDMDTLKSLKHLLFASFFALCAISTLMLFMSVYAGKVFYLGEAETIDLIAVSTIFAILSSIASGLLSDRIGYGKSLLGTFFLWILACLGGVFLKKPFHWLVGALVGVSLGATWVITRALVIKLVPENKIGMAFGIFNLVTYIAGIIGPLFWGLMLVFLSPLGESGYRTALFIMMFFVITGTAFLFKLKEELKNV